ncbi:ras and EF-hand domain-containing protein homolog isoform X2 [Lineus longissimus]|uniref:ras and EF-hand domain-containing protein homolog isoform X2 n=1 Tax=Lineus longissimus TaxID=88925 RepID=UPI00315D10E8
MSLRKLKCRHNSSRRKSTGSLPRKVKRGNSSREDIRVFLRKMAADDDDKQRLLFKACDINKSGFIEKSDLIEFGANHCWVEQDIDDLLWQLDKDNDEKLSLEEFMEGLQLEALDDEDENTDEEPPDKTKSKGPKPPPPILRPFSVNNPPLSPAMKSPSFDKFQSDFRYIPPRRRHSVCTELPGKDRCGFCDDLSCNIVLLSSSSQEQVVELYQTIHTDYPQLLPVFEKIILDVIRDIRFHQLENERLESSYKREKETHERHLRQLEEDIEHQMQKTENRVRKEERERAEQEKLELKQALEMEMQELQTNLKRLQQLEMQFSEKVSDETVLDMRRRLEDTSTENRVLKSDITDAQTNQAILRSELATLRQQYEDKCRDLKNEKDTLLEYMKEQDNLTRQLHLLHDANKRLHDTNDDLRAALDATRSNHKRNKSEPPSRFDEGRGSVVGAYLASGADGRPRSVCSSLPEEESLAICDPAMAIQRRPYRQRSIDKDSLPEDFGVLMSVSSVFDSGHSTLRDLNEFDSEFEAQSFDGDRHSYRYMETETETEAPDSHDEMDTEVELDLYRSRRSRSGSRSPSHSRPHSVASSRGSSMKSVKVRNARRQLPAIPKEVQVKPINQEPERMYKVVLAGDAAVGKSSFIMRLCKGKFVNNLNSTLGVDFQTKTIEIDNRVIALQLWDTAGQERFRSIAKSYFRRADGVLLLYDCTYERSFINVRDWVEAVEDGAQKKIPIMLVANKTDLREEYEAEGRRTVKASDGERLAKSFDALFIESSAKDGNNILEAVTDLARILRTNEDIEVQAAGLQLRYNDDRPKKSTSTPCCNA